MTKLNKLKNTSYIHKLTPEEAYMQGYNDGEKAKDCSCCGNCGGK